MMFLSRLSITHVGIIAVVAAGLLTAPSAVPNEASAARALLLQSDEKTGNCVVDPKVLADLSARKSDFEKRETEIKARDEELKAREVALQEQLNKLEEMRKQLTQTKLELTEKQSQQVGKLVETFERMSPKSSAKVMAEVEEELAVEAMSRMSTEKLAKILTNLDPAKSSRLSELMALGRSPAKQQPLSGQGVKR